MVYIAHSLQPTAGDGDDTMKNWSPVAQFFFVIFLIVVFFGGVYIFGGEGISQNKNIYEDPNRNGY